MKERPILMCGEMVRATLEGRKTNTRRTNGLDYINERPHWHYAGMSRDNGLLKAQFDNGKMLHEIKCPYGLEGDYLWVKETFSAIRHCHVHFDGKNFQKQDEVKWKADKPQAKTYEEWADGGDMWMHNAKWKPSILMPRKASRITLEITGVRVERLNEISKEDAIAEGIEQIDGLWKCYNPKLGWKSINDPIISYRSLWESLNGRWSWDLNPWVWVIDFKKP